MRRRLLSFGPFALAMALLGVPSLVAAQSDAVPTQSPSAYRFYRAPGHGFVLVDDAQVLGQLTPYVDVTLDYAHQPFRIVDLAYYTGRPMAPVPTGAHTDIVGGMLTTQITGALAIGDRVQIGLNVPIILYAWGDGFQWNQVSGSGGGLIPRSVQGGSISTLGDPRLHVLVTFLDPRESGWLGLAAAVYGTAPVANAIAQTYVDATHPIRYLYTGDPAASVGGHFVMSVHVEHFRGAINLGAAYHEPAQLIYSRRTSEMTYGAAVSYDFDTMVSVMAEITGQTTFGLSFDDEAPTEIRAAGLFHFGDFTLHAGLGAGIAYAIGVPVVRATIGGSWSPTVVADSDGDGLRDDVDACPSEAEDRDGRIDDDGCPEEDDDEDHVLDANDRCPDQAEDIDEYQDEDGCPDEDDDGDGVADGYDSCPHVAEDRDGDRDDDGCPDGDRDRDGVEDATDHCIDQAEDTDGYADEDGCPEVDADGDGVADTDDECGDQAEDLDGYQDGDGCPEEGPTARAGRGTGTSRPSTTGTTTPPSERGSRGGGGGGRHRRRRPR
ncbi:MAG: hypothetical protein U0234_13120 [Sandaracinus sp.]